MNTLCDGEVLKAMEMSMKRDAMGELMELMRGNKKISNTFLDQINSAKDAREVSIVFKNAIEILINDDEEGSYLRRFDIGDGVMVNLRELQSEFDCDNWPKRRGKSI